MEKGNLVQIIMFTIVKEVSSNQFQLIRIYLYLLIYFLMLMNVLGNLL